MNNLFFFVLALLMGVHLSSCGIGGGTLKSPTGKSLIKVEAQAQPIRAPTLTASIVMGDPSSVITNSGPISYVITFESIADANLLSLGSISLLTSDAITSTIELVGSGLQRQINLVSILGEGTFRLKLTLAGEYFVSTLTNKVTVDKTAPIVISDDWVLSNPSSGSTASSITPMVSATNLNSFDEGAFVSLYDIDNCATENLVGSGTISNGGITVSNISYTLAIESKIIHFYVKIMDLAQNESVCTNLNLNYYLDLISNPADPTGFILSSPANGVTSNDYTPQVVASGLTSGLDGAVVNIYDNSNCLSQNIMGMATISGAGSFTVSNISYTNDGSVDGVKSFYGQLVRDINHQSHCVALNLSYKLDTVNPSNPSGWTLASPSSGSNSNDSTPGINGSNLSAENGSFVYIYDDGGACSATPVGVSTISGGSFTVSSISYATDGSADGAKSFYGKISDIGGNSSSCVNLSLGYNLDTVVPSVPSGLTLSSVSDGSTSGVFTPVINGAGLASENGSYVKIYLTVSCPVSEEIGTATIGGGTFAVSNISFATDSSDDGNKIFYVTYTDGAGNTTGCTNSNLNYEFDSGLASVAITTPSASNYINNTNKAAITVSGSCSSNGRPITVAATGGLSSTSNCVGNGWTTSLNFTAVGNGSITITADHTNESNNSAPQASVTLTKDALVPADPSGLALASPSSGSTSSDFTPTVNGSGLGSENGSFVFIYDNVGCATPKGSATIVAGTFTVSSITYLNNGTDDGTKAFYGKITDVAGNSSICVDLSIGYKLDTTSPSNPSGWAISSPSNGATSADNTPAIHAGSLVSENTSLITIYDVAGCGSGSIGSAIISAGGTFTVGNISYLTNGTNDGAKVFYGKVTDLAANASSCTALSLGYLFDTTAPANPSGLTMQSPNTGSTSNDNTPQILGAGLGGENGGVIEIFDDAGTCADPEIGSATITSGAFTVSNISYAVNGSADGTKTFYGKIIDVSGNASACVNLSLSYLLDKTNPSDPSNWTLASPANGATSSDYTPQISKAGLVSEDGSIAYIYDAVECETPIDSVVVAAGGFTATNITYASNGTQDGTKTFYGKLVDVSGNSSNCVSLSRSYLLDTTNPAVASGWSITSPSNGSTSSDNTPEINKSGIVGEDGAQINIYGSVGCGAGSIGSATIASGSFTVGNISYATNGTADGAKIYFARITDVAGNTNACTALSLGYLFDTTTPNAPSGWSMSSPSSGATSNDSTPSILGSGLATEVNSTITIYGTSNCLSGVIGSATIVSGGNFTVSNISYATNGSADGTKSFYGIITDGALHATACTDLSLGYLFDTTAPSNPSAWSIQSPSTGATSTDNTPEIYKDSGLTENGGTINIYDDAGVCAASGVGTATIVGGGFTVTNISYASNGTQDGTKTFYGKITDVAGNPSSCVALTLDYLLDAGTPSAPSGWAMSSPNTGTTSTDITPEIHAGGLATENNSLITIYDVAGCASGVVGSATISVGGTFTVSNITYLNNGTQDGIKPFYGKITDGVGHETACTSLSLDYTLDTTNPTIAITSPTNGSNVDGTTTISGTCSDNGRTVTVGATGGLLGTTSCSGGNFSLNLNFSGVAAGAKTVTADFSDAAGNNATQASVNVVKIIVYKAQKIILGDSLTACAILSDSTIKCWGNPYQGHLGQGNSNPHGEDVDQMGTNLSTINLGSGKVPLDLIVNEDQVCALLSDSNVKCWGCIRGRDGEGSCNYNTGTSPDEMGDNISTVNLGPGAASVVLKLSSGKNHVCALLSDSSLKCWGENDGGRLGQGHNNFLGDVADEMGTNLSSINLGSNKFPIDVVAGGGHTCAILNDSSVKCFGYNDSGELGLGNGNYLGDVANEMGDNLSTINLGTGKYALSLSIGTAHICALLNDSNVKCFGQGGTLGQGNNSFLGMNADQMGDNLSTIILGTGKLAIKISSGNYYNCVLLNDATVKCFGDNNFGQLGQGHVTTLGVSPDQMGDNLSTLNLGSGRKAQDIVSKRNSNCALLDNSSVKCFGYNSSGVLGQGHENNLGDNPNEMGDNLSHVNTGNSSSFVKASLDKKKLRVQTLVAGGYHTCAILNDFSVKCWGENDYGQLGQGNYDNLGDQDNEMGENLSLVNLGTGKQALTLGTGSWHTCALLNDSSVKCWGGNQYGQLGQGNYDNLGDDANEMGDNLSSINLGTGKLSLAISVGSGYNCALLNDSSVKCWGDNYSGNLGQGNYNNLGDEADEMGENLSSVNLGTGKQAFAVGAGSGHTCALLNDSSVKCWGYNFAGQLGQGHTNYLGYNANEMGDNLSSINLGTGKWSSAISVGFHHTCVLLNDSSAKCWGYNAYGWLGQGHQDTLGDDANEMGENLSSIDLGTGKKALTIGMGSNDTCALLNDSSVKCWGRNQYGQLGQGHQDTLGDDANEMGENLSSIDLGTGKKALTIGMGSNYTCALLNDSSVKCWGFNQFGQLGQGNPSHIGQWGSQMGDFLIPILLW